MTHTESATKKAHLTMWIWTLIVGLSFPIVSLLSVNLPLILLTALRFLIALLALLPFVPATDRVLPARQALLLYLVLGACLAGFFSAMFWAAPRISSVTMSSLYVTVPLLSYFITAFSNIGKRPKGLLLVLLTGAAGALLLARTATGNEGAHPEQIIGVMVFLFGCISAASYPVLSKWGLHKGWLLTNAATRTAWSLLAGALITALIGTLLESPYELIQVTAVDLAVLIFLGIFSTALTFWLSQFATTFLMPPEVQAYSYLVPLVSIAVLFAQGNANFNLLLVPGITLVLACIWMLLKRTPEVESPKQASAVYKLTTK